MFLPVGQIIVCKVFVGHSTPIRVGQPVDRSHYPKAYSVYRNVDAKQRTAMSEGMWYLTRRENNFLSVFVQCHCFCMFLIQRDPAPPKHTLALNAVPSDDSGLCLTVSLSCLSTSYILNTSQG